MACSAMWARFPCGGEMGRGGGGHGGRRAGTGG